MDAMIHIGQTKETGIAAEGIGKAIIAILNTKVSDHLKEISVCGLTEATKVSNVSVSGCHLVGKTRPALKCNG